MDLNMIKNNAQNPKKPFVFAHTVEVDNLCICVSSK